MKDESNQNKHSFIKIIEMGRHYWVDMNTGIRYNKLNINPKKAKHGLCEKYGRDVVKTVIYNGRIPNKIPHEIVLVERASASIPRKIFNPITIQFMDADKNLTQWQFTSLDISEILKGLEKEQSLRSIATRICCPQEALKNLMKSKAFKKSVLGQ